MTQGQFELSPTLDEISTQKLITTLGLGKSDLDERCPIQIASTGHSLIQVPHAVQSFEIL